MASDGWFTEQLGVPSKYAIEVKSGRHTLMGDLMPAAGGQDVGPSPKEYVMAAVVSCTLMVRRRVGVKRLMRLACALETQWVRVLEEDELVCCSRARVVA